MCPDCVNAHELLRNVAFEGHKVRPIKHFQAEDYEALLKRQSFCSQQYHEREVRRFFCIDCQTRVCQVCVVTDHKNHTFDPLDKAADAEKANVMAAVELIKEKSKVCSDVIREFELTAADLETNSTAAKQKVTQTAEQMINRIREREREAITAIENTRVSRNEKLNAAKAQVESLIKKMNQAVEFSSIGNGGINTKCAKTTNMKKCAKIKVGKMPRSNAKVKNFRNAKVKSQGQEFQECQGQEFQECQECAECVECLECVECENQKRITKFSKLWKIILRIL